MDKNIGLRNIVNISSWCVSWSNYIYVYFISFLSLVNNINFLKAMLVIIKNIDIVYYTNVIVSAFFIKY